LELGGYERIGKEGCVRGRRRHIIERGRKQRAFGYTNEKGKEKFGLAAAKKK